MTYISVFLAGYILAIMICTLRGDAHYERICQDQQERGDYWFARYLQAARKLADIGYYTPNEDPKNFYDGWRET